jgi:small subunit ribosomal protein S16
VAVKIKLRRVGKKHTPFYRVVISDVRNAGKTGRFIEEIGIYNPKAKPKLINIDKEKALDWIEKGAKPTDSVKRLLKPILESN